MCAARVHRGTKNCRVPSRHREWRPCSCRRQDSPIVNIASPTISCRVVRWMKVTQCVCPACWTLASSATITSSTCKEQLGMEKIAHPGHHGPPLLNRQILERLHLLTRMTLSLPKPGNTRSQRRTKEETACARVWVTPIPL